MLIGSIFDAGKKILPMKIRNPRSRFDLSIKKNYRVLEIGGGHNPHYRANVVVDKFVDTNFHRSGDIKVFKNQRFVAADGEDLPFEDKSFDYTICNQVLEHVDDPIKFLNEQVRVAPRGYVETPSIMGEYLIPKESHRWLLQEIDNKIIMYDKEIVGFRAPAQDFSYMFLDYLPTTSVGYKIMIKNKSNIFSMNYEWEDEIEVLVNPENAKYYDYFTKPWDEKICNELFRRKSMPKEAISSISAFLEISKSVLKNRVLKKA